MNHAGQTSSQPWEPGYVGIQQKNLRSQNPSDVLWAGWERFPAAISRWDPKLESQQQQKRFLLTLEDLIWGRKRDKETEEQLEAAGRELYPRCEMSRSSGNHPNPPKSESSPLPPPPRGVHLLGCVPERACTQVRDPGAQSLSEAGSSTKIREV